MVASLTELGSTTMTVAYFEREGYYAKNDPRQRRASFWHGEGAAALGLPKQVSPKAFERILGGYVPGTQTRLGRARDGEHEHRPGLDLTLSAPKSVSLEALLYGDRRVLGAHDAAVRATLDWVEAALLQTRGYDPATGQRPRAAAHGLVAAGFRHLTSRDQDPQLHTHCILVNMTRNKAGEWRSVEPTLIRRNVRLLGAYYRQEMARRLIEHGFRIEPTMIGGVPGFEIAGYPRKLLDAFSSRRREILAWLDSHGLPWSAALTQQAALITRKRKVERDIEALKADWKARAEGLGLSRERGIARPGHGKRSAPQTVPITGRPYVRTAEELRPEAPRLSVGEIVWRAVEHLSERASVFRESDIRAIALGHAPGRHELGEIDAAVTGLLADGHLVEANVRGGRAFVTGEALRLEREIVARMREGIGAANPLAAEARVSARLARTALTAGQKEAVRTILLSRDRVVAVQGAAGTGKTAMLREALSLSGERKSILLAPSAAAARVLSQETGAPARTLQWFLTRYGDTGNAAKMERARGEHEGSVLVLDESSMTATAQMALLMRISGRVRIARLVLVGDRGQLRAVSAGEPFRALQDAGVATAAMDEILRQRDPGLRTVVERLQQGRAGEAVRGLGEVHEVAQEALGAEAARLWLALAPGSRAGTAILAPTHFIRAEIHRVVRDGLAREGLLHGRELEIERYVNRHLTAAQRADIRNHEPGDIVIFHSRVPPLRVEEGAACRVVRAEGDSVFLEHPSGRTVRIRPGDSWVRYRFGLYETARIRVRAGDRIRWTANDRKRGLVNGGEAAVLEIDARRVRFDLGEGKAVSLPRDDPQLRHIDHAWSSTVHAAQGMTRDAAIGVLDTGHGRLTGQAGLYVEASRARDRFVLVTDNRALLEEVLEGNEGVRMTALEAVGDDDDSPPGARGAGFAMLRELREDWRTLVARGEMENTELDRMEGYGRIVTGVASFAEGTELPAALGAFADEVRRRDTEFVARKRRELAFVQRADMHCRKQPLLEWAAEERGRPASELPAYADWLAEGAALTQTGRRMEESVGKGFTDRIAGALRRIVRSFGLDEGERFREAAVRHEAQARALGIDPHDRPGAVELAGRARALRGRELPKRVRRMVEAWSDGNETRAPCPEETHRRPAQHPEHEEASRRIETFLQDCRDHLGEAALAGEELIPESRSERTETLRREGLRMLGDGEGAQLADPVRIRLGHVAQERERVREVVDALGEKVQRLRAEAFMALHRRVDRQRLEERSEPVDLPAWAALRDRAEALRGEAGLAPEVREALDTVLARDARGEVELAPVDALLTAAAEHLHRRAALEKEARELEVEISGLAAMPGWRARSRELRDAARRLLGETQDNAPAMRAGARLADMPRLQARVREVVDRLETVRLTDNVADFRSLANAVEGRAHELRILPLHADGYARVTALAEGLTKREVLPDAVRHEVGGWVERDRGWRAELASVRELTGADTQRAEPARLREAASYPAVAAAIRRETARLARAPTPERAREWTGDTPLVAGDRLAWTAGGDTRHAVVIFPGESGGLRESDTLRLGIVRPEDRTAPTEVSVVEVGVRSLTDIRCRRASWTDEGLRALEVARQHAVPGPVCRLSCAEPIPGDRIAWTEAAGLKGEVCAIEAVVADRAEGPERSGHGLELRVSSAAGPGAPEPGSRIERTADAVTARGCFRAEWAEERRRERILNPPAHERTREQQEEVPEERRYLSQDKGLSM